MLNYHWDSIHFTIHHMFIFLRGGHCKVITVGFRTMIISFEEAGDDPAAIKSTPFPYDKCYTCIYIYIYIYRERERERYSNQKNKSNMETWKYKVGHKVGLI